MDPLEGIWRLVESRAWDEQGNVLPAPYGAHPLGQISFAHGRMLAALCNGDAMVGSNAPRAFSAYGGVYTFDGTTLIVDVDIASDPRRAGGRQTRGVVMTAGRMTLHPPERDYGRRRERRELVWERVWRAAGCLNDPDRP